MERIATDTYTFRDLRDGGFVYVDKYRASGRRITLLGIGFSAEKRDISDWKVEVLQ